MFLQSEFPISDDYFMNNVSPALRVVFRADCYTRRVCIMSGCVYTWSEQCVYLVESEL